MGDMGERARAKYLTGAGILERIEARLERLEARLDAADDGWVDQTKSPLGRRRHCAAVRRLVESRDARAAIRGRAHLMTRELLAEQLAALSVPKPGAAVNDIVPDDDEERGAYYRALNKALKARN